MSTFRNGVGNLVPPGIPVIPMRIGMTWGSIFSCSNAGKFKLQLPGMRRHPASVTVGKPIDPDTNAYEMRIIISELAAETELPCSEVNNIAPSVSKIGDLRFRQFRKR
jgi:hypothetical protein